MTNQVPKRWRAYPCEEYFEQGWAEAGHFDHPSQTLVIVPLSKAYENEPAGFLAIGRSGADGIDFGYRRDQSGLWAYFPIGEDFKFMAPTVRELVADWCGGKLSV